MNTKHRWPLWQPNQTANFPALAIIRVSGLTTNPGAKAFAPHLLKTHECRANNAELSGDLVMKAKPQCKGRPAAIGRVLQRLVIILRFSGVSFGTKLIYKPCNTRH